MASGLFDKYKEAITFPGTLGTTSGDAVDLETDTIKVALVDHGVVDPNLSTHDYYDDISSAVVGTPQTLTSKTNTDGQFDAADVTFSSVSGNTCESLVLFKDTGTPSTSMLIAKIDSGTGLPVTPGGGDITVEWDTYIFAI